MTSVHLVVVIFSLYLSLAQPVVGTYGPIVEIDGSCLTVSVIVNMQNNKFLNTREQHNNKEIYLSEDLTQEIIWHYSRWNIVNQGDRSPPTTAPSCSANLVKDCKTSLDLFVTACESYTTSNYNCGGHYRGTGMPHQPAMCDTTSDHHCCGPFNACGSGSQTCDCPTCLDHRKISANCLFENVVTPVSHCSITKLDMVDHQIKEQVLWNTFQVVIGES